MDPSRTLCVGRPVFDDAQARNLAESQGVAAAWLDLWTRRGAQSASASIGGDFALAARDAQGRSLLAVDRFAARTLCYRVVDGGLRFAARADELADPGTPVDPQALFDYLYFHVIPSPRTIFQGVQRLPPGHYALFENGRLTVAPYWTPAFASDRSGRATLDDLKTEFRGLLEQAVGRQLDGSKPACYLSGGTDSSTVAGMIGKVAGRPAATYSIGFDAQGYDEMEFARVTARHFGTDHHEYYVTPGDLAGSMAMVAQSFDQPFGNSSALPAYCCARMAAGDGVSRLLAGDGGDELFGGNTRYAKQRLFDAYGQVPGFLRRGVVEPMFTAGAVRRMPLLKKGASYIEQARVPMPDREQMYNLLHRLGVQRVLTPAMLAAVDQSAPLRAQREVWAAARGARALDRHLAFDWRYTLADCDLPKVRGSAALAGLDVGFPLLDRDLLDFSMRLPPSFKVRGLKLRWFFKEALRGFLPDATLSKRKQGFGLPFGVWAVRDDALSRLARDTLGSLGERGVVDARFIDTLMRDLLPAHPGYYGEMVWILMMLELWMQGHVPSFRLQG